MMIIELFVPVVIIYFWNSFLPLQWNLIVQYIYLFVCLTKCELKPVLYCFFAWCYAIKNSQFVKNQNIHYMRLYVCTFFSFCKCNWLCGKNNGQFCCFLCWIFFLCHRPFLLNFYQDAFFVVALHHIFYTTCIINHLNCSLLIHEL